MPSVQPTRRSPPPPVASSSRMTPPPPASPTTHQVGARQATRSRTRTRGGPSHGGPSQSSSSRQRYSSEDHPLSPHKLSARGYHSFKCLEVPFHVHKRYTFLRELGIGAYGCVALARDSVLDCNVAIKKVTRVFERDVLARRALREVAVLRHIGMCGNVTALLDFDASFIEFNEIYLVMEASEADLSQIIRSGQSLSDSHLQYFLAQILRGVRYMHAANVIHRDLKPGNLLVNADCQLKLCDFGLARAHASTSALAPPPHAAGSDSSHHSEPEQDQATPGRPAPPTSDDGRLQSPEVEPVADTVASVEVRHSSMSQTVGRAAKATPDAAALPSRLRTSRLAWPGGPLTEYVATRWYRAPEVMLCFKGGYGSELDMWSVGCILAELIAGKPIFAGKDYVDQIARINNVLGSPSQATIDKIGSERAKTYVKSLPLMPAVPFSKLYPKASPLAIDLLSKLLTWDPDERISAQEALEHPWLAAYHKSNASWTRPEGFSRFAEVELIESIGDFKRALERESNELKDELAAMEAEEAEERRLEEECAQAEAAAHNDAGPDDSEAELRETAAPQSAAGSTATSGPAGSSSSCSVSSQSRTRPVSASSPDASPLPTPSSPATSADAYETDPTSASAPHSLSNSFSKHRRGREVSSDVYALGDADDDTTMRARVLDESLIAHGLLRPQSDAAHLERPAYRRRALSNAICLSGKSAAAQRRAADSDLTLSVRSLMPFGVQRITEVPPSPAHRTDIIARPRHVLPGVSRRPHEGVLSDHPTDTRWRDHLRRCGLSEEQASQLSHMHLPALNSASPRAFDIHTRDESREGSDSTVGRRGGSPGCASRSSPIAA